VLAIAQLALDVKRWAHPKCGMPAPAPTANAGIGNIEALAPSPLVRLFIDESLLWELDVRLCMCITDMQLNNALPDASCSYVCIRPFMHVHHWHAAEQCASRCFLFVRMHTSVYACASLTRSWTMRFQMLPVRTYAYARLCTCITDTQLNNALPDASCSYVCIRPFMHVHHWHAAEQCASRCFLVACMRACVHRHVSWWTFSLTSAI